MDSAEETLEVIRRISGVRIEPGLTPWELTAAESQFNLRFPPDLAELLRTGLPTGERWPNWRAAVNAQDDAAQALSLRLNWPRDGMCFDVEHNAFWDPAWGERPSVLAEALRIAEGAVRTAPLLIPVYAHRFLPAEPCAPGNPVLSVHQTDIIVYGRDLYEYFLAEAGGWNAEATKGARVIRSWTRWMSAEWNGSGTAHPA